MQPAGADLPSFITSNADFYRIDTALAVPQLSREEWKLRIHGMVDREITYTLADLAGFEGGRTAGDVDLCLQPGRRKPHHQRHVDGLPGARPVEAGRNSAGCRHVLSTSSDGFTAGTPIEALTDSREALLASG